MEGWKLVPVEPTQEMLSGLTLNVSTRRNYELMLEAAPTPPQQNELVAAALDVLDYFDKHIYIIEYGFLRRLEHMRKAAEKSAPLSDTPEGYDS